MREPPGGLRRGARLRPLAEPRPVEVRADTHGEPLAVVLDRRPVPVVAVRERWRIDDEWWRRPVARMYHLVVLDGGALLTLYRDLVDDRWYVHG